MQRVDLQYKSARFDAVSPDSLGQRPMFCFQPHAQIAPGLGCMKKPQEQQARNDVKRQATVALSPRSMPHASGGFARSEKRVGEHAAKEMRRASPSDIHFEVNALPFSVESNATRRGSFTTPLMTVL